MLFRRTKMKTADKLLSGGKSPSISDNEADDNLQVVG